MAFWKFYFFIALLILGLESFSQQKEYWFLTPKNPYRDTIKGMKFHAEYEFSYTRIYIKDSCFQEKGVWGRDAFTGSSDIFKIKNGNWFIKVKHRWKLFYSKTAEISPTIYVYGTKYSLQKEGNEKINGVDCIKLYLKSFNFYSGNHTWIWFSPKYGIIRQDYDGVILIREDIREL
jgi:hypothetical protein